MFSHSTATRPKSFVIPNIPHLQQPNDFSCSEIAAIILHDTLGVNEFGNGANGTGDRLQRFVNHCAAKIGVPKSDKYIHFENMLPCMSPKLDCRVENLRSIDDLKQTIFTHKTPLILRYKVTYNHSVVVGGYTPNEVVLVDPGLPYNYATVNQNDLDRWWKNKGRPVMICKKT